MTVGRLQARFAGRRAQGRSALIFYVAAADPAIALTPQLLHALVAGGADVIELGYPFCDPILDGPVIRQANRRALDAGGSIDATLAIVQAFRRNDAETPIVLMGYANPVISRGPALFDAMARAGADGLIIPDLPLREAVAVLPAIVAAQLCLIPLVPPSGMVDARALRLPGVGGFLYAIAQAGPTGSASALDPATVRDLVEACRALADLPVGVGFGIKTPQMAAQLKPHGDAIIVGSALVDHIHTLVQQGDDGDALQSAVTAFAQAFRQAIDAA